MKPTFALTGMTLAAATLLCSCAPAPHSEAAYTVANCGREVAFTHAPERVVLQDSTAVATLDGLGVLDKVVAKAGFFPPEYFTDAVNAQLDAIASLSDRLNNTGHIQITKEVVMAENPDLIIGYSDTVNPQTAGEVPILSEPGFCGEITSASWADVDAHIDLYARAMGVPERAGAVKEGVDTRVAQLDASVGSGRSVAFVYPGVEGGTTYGYGAASMAAPVSESLGLRNVFADVSERVFEISAEQLVAANPDVIVVLNSGEDNTAGAVTSLPGADSIAAVRSGEVIPMYLSFVEPASPLSVAGAEELQRALELKS